jgi:hypothetical protein
MTNLSPIDRPVTVREIAIAFDVTAPRLERVLVQHNIAPPCRIGRTRVYGPVEIRRIYAALSDARTTT